MTAIERKVPTKAWLEADNYRSVMNAGRKDLLKIVAKDLSSTVFTYTNINDLPCAIYYRGRAKKPFHGNGRGYRTPEDRLEAVNKFILGSSEHANRSRPKANRGDVAIDDVFCASWGYDQTNVDYYKVVGLVGKTMVELVKIGGLVGKLDGYMSGEIIPDINNVLDDKVYRKRVTDNRVKIDSVRTAYKKVPIGVDSDGNPEYKGDYWSSYH